MSTDPGHPLPPPPSPPPSPSRGPGENEPLPEPPAAYQLDLLTRLLDLLPDFFYVHDWDLRFYYANKRACDYFGVPRERLLGRTLEELDPDKEQARRFVEACRAVMRDGRPRLTDNLPYARPDGTGGFLRQHDIPFLHPQTGSPMLVGLSRDVTAERELERERMRAAALERELSIARQIQASLRPPEDVLPPGHSLELAAHSEPATYAGGDFYDWFPTLDGRIAVCIGDVTGHGLGPALLAAECRAYARVLLRTRPPMEAVEQLGAMLTPDLSEGRFVTFATAVIDTRTGEGEFVSAGHGPVLLRRSAGDVEPLPTQRPPLGIDLPVDADPVSLRLRPGDQLILASDGVFEARDPGGTQFGIQRLTRELSGATGIAREVVAQVLGAMSAFTNGRANDDDVTLVIARRSQD